MKERIVIICVGYLLDRIIGDPCSLWHPVQGIGKLIEWIEKILWKVFRLSNEKEADKIKKRIAGGFLVILVLGITMGTTVGLLYLVGRFSPQLRLAWECIICYQMIAMKSLKTESMKVYDALMGENPNSRKRGREDVTCDFHKSTDWEKLQAGRKAVSLIVGRDTGNLSEEEVVKATVETIAENTSDGVIAPMFYMCIFGPLGGLFYKVVNTLDSMVAYKNERYIYFGTLAAKMDDILNYVPSRVSALFMLVACSFTDFDGKNAWKIFKRDRYNHASPNSAQTEAVCAGALNIELGGPAYYFGELYEKPAIGDANRKVEAEDIVRANELLYATANVMVVIYIIIAMTIYLRF